MLWVMIFVIVCDTMCECGEQTQQCSSSRRKQTSKCGLLYFICDFAELEY